MTSVRKNANKPNESDNSNFHTVYQTLCIYTFRLICMVLQIRMKWACQQTKRIRAFPDNATKLQQE